MNISRPYKNDTSEAHNLNFVVWRNGPEIQVLQLRTLGKLLCRAESGSGNDFQHSTTTVPESFII